jgi:hypothetical protein
VWEVEDEKAAAPTEQGLVRFISAMLISSMHQPLIWKSLEGLVSHSRQLQRAAAAGSIWLRSARRVSGCSGMYSVCRPATLTGVMRRLCVESEDKSRSSTNRTGANQGCRTIVCDACQIIFMRQPFPRTT